MEQKILCISGASSDVGKCLVRTVANEYDAVVCHYWRSMDVIEELVKEMGDKVIPIQADFSDENATIEFAHEVIERELAPQHFVHIAATSSAAVSEKFAKTDWNQFEREMNIMFRSAVILSQAFLPRMAKKGYGKAVYMLSSQVVWNPAKPYCAAYACAKHALLGLVECLASEYARKHVSVNAVSPSMMDTKFMKVSEIVKQVNIENSPIKRLLKPEDVVPAFAFLLSSGADTITGQNIPVMAGN